uniref:Uncharacterized protein n=1 Tax=Oryza meridionalis TaxID=40149 RepID=A0A0E0DEH9_9ORYZ
MVRLASVEGFHLPVSRGLPPVYLTPTGLLARSIFPIEHGILTHDVPGMEFVRLTSRAGGPRMS